MAADWSFLANFNLSSPNITTAFVPQTSAMKYGFGGGMSFSIGGGSALKIAKFEAGLFYITKKYNTTYLGQDTDFLFSFFELPISVRFKIFKWLWIGGGGYTALGMGNVSTSVPSAPGFLQVDNTYAALNLSQFDAGVQASIMLAIPLSSQASLVADFRSSWGLINLDMTSTNSLKMADYTVFVGIRLGDTEQSP